MVDDRHGREGRQAEHEPPDQRTAAGLRGADDLRGQEQAGQTDQAEKIEDH